MPSVSRLLAALCAGAAFFLHPASAQNSAPARVPADMAAFFGGAWSGKGAFASGRPIEAEVSFTPELDGQWLLYRHSDRAPNSYKALGMWGIESASRKLLMTVNDNFGGARSFASEGWQDGKVIFSRTISAEPLREERFVFERRSANSFHMAYEVRPGDKPWRLVDQLLFERVQ